MASDVWIWVRIHRRIAAAVAAFMRGTSEKLHESARNAIDPDKQRRLTEEADDYHHVGKQIQREYGIMPSMKDNSVTGNSAPVAKSDQSVTLTEHSKLLPWLMLACMVGGVALGVSAVGLVANDHAESRMEMMVQNNRAATREDLQNARADLREEANRFYRQVQEYRIRVEEAENAAAQVNPNFHPIRQPKEK